MLNQALDAVTNANGLLAIDEAKHCLTSRAKCYLAMSDHKNAYLDAEKSLEDDPDFVKGIHMKVGPERSIAVHFEVLTTFCRHGRRKHFT